MTEIDGVSVKELTSHADDRGFFREIIRSTDPFFTPGFGQWSHSKMTQNTVKAWHFHHRQVDWWYCPLGLLQVVLYDGRDESPTFHHKSEFLLGEPESDSRALVAAVRIPPGVLHGCKVLSPVAHLFYITSATYDPEDEGRYPFDSEVVPHSWGKSAELIVAPRDRVLHIPKHNRES